MKVEKVSVRLFNAGTSLKGFASIILSDDSGDSMLLDGFKVMEKKDHSACFVSYPSTKFKNKEGNDEYKDTTFPINAELRDKINKSILQAYEYKLNKENRPQTVEVEAPVRNTVADDELLPF